MNYLESQMIEMFIQYYKEDLKKIMLNIFWIRYLEYITKDWH
jgi:hypothetical protein